MVVVSQPAPPAALRYVVLLHDGIAKPHFDLMFESSPGSALVTLRCDEWPVRDPGRMERIGDHRREYLDYEGQVSGGRGFVRRVASGTCELDAGPGVSLVLRLDNGLTLRIPRSAGE